MGYIADLLFSFFRCSQICLLVFYYLQCESWYLWCFASETERYYLDIRQLPLTTSLKKTKFVVSWLRNGMNCAIHILHSTELKNEGVTCVVVQSLSLVHLLQPHGLQPARLHCFSLSPRVCSNSCPVLTVAFWPAYRFLKRQVRWSDIPISFRIFHSLLWSTQSKALA